MKREIKFRAWDWVDRTMIDWEGITCHGDLMYAVFHKNNLYDLQQFTGFYDKNGNEIYEGDYVFVDNSEPEEKGEYDVFTTCKWDNNSFVLEDLAGGQWTRQLYHQPQRLTLAGNIHENPALSEG